VTLISTGLFTNAWSAEKVQTLTFAWDYTPAAGQVAVTIWEMHWSVTEGGPYTKLADIPNSGNLQAPITATVTGQPGTSETRYFVLKACGDAPKEGGGTEYLCSVPSNETSYAFWIDVTGFSAPVQFRILPQ